jgi:hypothetical protein
MEENDQIAAVKDRHSDELRAIPGVIGVGIGSGQCAIQVHITGDNPALPALLPKEIEGFPVELVIHREPFRAF